MMKKKIRKIKNPKNLQFNVKYKEYFFFAENGFIFILYIIMKIKMPKI